MEKTGKKKLEIQSRSDGDGMEYSTYLENKPTKDLDNLSEHLHSNFVPFFGKRKEPKFVPYEPYKAAVSPIIPISKKNENIGTHFVIDSQKVSSLASSVIHLDSMKKTEIKALSAVKPLTVKECEEGCIEKVKELEEKISKLERENKDLRSQFKIQTEVNADLKKMLIASLGEDMHLKVQYMTEDKARLGMNVLQFTEELALKEEDIEKLSVQCDVWKSKFDASSVLVDELARWKLTLSETLKRAMLALESMLSEHRILSDELCSAYSTLCSTIIASNPQVVSKWDHRPQTLLQLSKEIKNLSTSVQERLLGRASPRGNSIFINNSCIQNSFAEQHALQVLKDHENLLFLSDDSINHLCHTPGRTACQILPHACSKEPTVNCCKQCSGDIQLL